MGAFEPIYSSDTVYYGENINRFLTTDIDNFEADITALQTAMSGLGNTYALKNHTHTGYATANDIASLQNAIAGKANANHTHSGYATTSDITTLQTALDGKADANHTHTGFAVTGHIHDDRYYTETEIDNKLSAKANATSLTNHTGNTDIHVTAANKTNWNAAYTHAQAAHAPSNAEENQNAFSYFKIGNTSVAANSKTDTITLIAGDNVTLTPNATNDSITISAIGGSTYVHPTTAGNKHIPSGGSTGQILNWSADGTAVWGDNIVSKAITTSGTGEAYTATVPGIDSLVSGVSFVMVPHITSTSKTPTLNVNGLGAKNLRRRISNSTMTTTFARYENWLAVNRPVRVFYDGTFWIADFTVPNALDLYGTVEIEHGGTGGNTVAKARANLDVYSKAEVDNLIAQAIANLSS